MISILFVYAKTHPEVSYKQVSDIIAEIVFTGKTSLSLEVQKNHASFNLPEHLQR
jgi:hypothetical protein